MMILSLLLVVAFDVTSCVSLQSGEDFFVIAHQMNTLQSIDHAMAEGANGVEIDLQFDESGQ